MAESWRSRHTAQETKVSKGESARGDVPQKTRRRVAESGRKGLLTKKKRAEEHNTFMHSVIKKNDLAHNHHKGNKTPRSNGDAQQKQT